MSIYCANKAMQILKAALALAAEDHEFRPPAMPTGLQRQRDKPRKLVLTPEEVAKLLAAARDDVVNGVYVAFPFLAGTRPSEQLGLLWDDVDFEANVTTFMFNLVSEAADQKADVWQALNRTRIGGPFRQWRVSL